MKKILFFVTIFLFLLVIRYSGGAKEIRPDTSRVAETLRFLTSSESNGRLTGTEGNERVMHFIANRFSQIGLENPASLYQYEQVFHQSVPIVKSTPVLEIIYPGERVERLKYIDDFGVINYIPGAKLSGEALGGVYLDGRQDSSGKFVLVTLKDLQNRYNGLTAFLKTKNQAAGVIIENSTPENYVPVAPNILYPNAAVRKDGKMFILVTKRAYNQLKTAAEAGAVLRIKLNNEIQAVQTANIIGYLKGDRPGTIIITAHLDHVGSNGDGFNPGALDNASGIAALLETARIEKEVKASHKTLVFIAFNGEEEGLYGSSYYLNHPVFPLADTEVVNLDMVGSKADVPLEINTCKKQNGGELLNFIEQITSHMGITLIQSDDQNSDHAPFCKNGIDAVNLIHPDFNNGYHSPYDTIDKVNLEKLADVIKIIIELIAADE